MKPLERILLILKSTVPVFILVIGISCSNNNDQNKPNGQNQSAEEHLHDEAEVHDDHDHDLGGPGARVAVDRTRGRCRTRHGPADLRGHAHRTIHDLYRADAVLRLRGTQDAGRADGRILGRPGRSELIGQH